MNAHFGWFHKPTGCRVHPQVQATRGITGETITSVEDVAANKEAVLGVATDLAIEVRRALGDDTSDSAQRFAKETLTAASLGAVRDYALAQEALSDNRFEDARKVT